MRKYTILIIAFLINGFVSKAYNTQPPAKDNDIDISVIVQTAQRAYYTNNDYEKAMGILSKASKYLKASQKSKYEDIVNVNWHQAKFTLFEKGATVAKPFIEGLMKDIESYHTHLSTGFSYSDNAVNLLLSDNVSKHFIYYPGGVQVISSMLDYFIKIYKKDFSGEQHLRMFQSLRSYIYLLTGNLKPALDLSAEAMRKADEYEKYMYAVNYGHALFLNKQGAEKTIEQYQTAFKLNEELVSKTLLMDFQTLRQFSFDISALKNYESQIKVKYLKKFYKRPYITEIKDNSEAKKVGLRVGDIIEMYNNEIIYDIEMFGIDRMSERFKQNQKSREIKVVRNGQRLTFTVAPGLLGVYLDYKK
jgi:tetratricopeptide (TPR) repeat protein